MSAAATNKADSVAIPGGKQDLLQKRSRPVELPSALAKIILS
jgi:hypothetical protein